MPTTNGRACTIEDGKVILSFRHYKDEYNTLNSNLDKMKNKMNIIISEDSIEIMQMKLNQFKNIDCHKLGKDLFIGPYVVIEAGAKSAKRCRNFRRTFKVGRI